jgi:hypothetical protein
VQNLKYSVGWVHGANVKRMQSVVETNGAG